MVLLDPDSTFADDPSSLFHDDPSNLTVLELDNDPSFVLGVPQIESDDSLEAMTKDTKRTRSNKYKKIMEQTRIHHVEEKYLPVLQPMYVSKSGQYRRPHEGVARSDRCNPNNTFSKPWHHRQDRYGSDKHVEASDPSRYRLADGIKNGVTKRERFAPFRRFDGGKSKTKQASQREQYSNEQKNRHYESINVDSKSNKFLSNRPKPLPSNSQDWKGHNLQQNLNEKKSNQLLSRISGNFNSGSIGSGSGKSNKYSMTLSQHRRSFPIEQESGRRSHSSHARLLSDGDESLVAPSGSIASTQYFSANSQSGRNSRTCGLSLESSKQSHKANLSSSLNTGASPDEILAFGAVLDHLTKGGSIMNANKVYQKEVRVLDKYRTGSPAAKANYKKPPAFVKKYENKYDEKTVGDENEEDTEFGTEFGTEYGTDYETEYETVYETDYDEVSRQETNGEDSVSTFKGDKYAATKACKKHDNRGENESAWYTAGEDIDDEVAKFPMRSKKKNVFDPFEAAGNEESVMGESVDSRSNFESQFAATTFHSDSESESDDDSLFSDEDISIDESATYQSYSTISSYHSKREKSRRPAQTEKKKSSKKKSLLHMLKGKKENDGDDIIVAFVDRLPDTFKDDNDENINVANKPKRQLKKIGEAIFSKKQYPKPSNPMALDKMHKPTGNHNSNKQMKTNQRNRKENDNAPTMNHSSEKEANCFQIPISENKDRAKGETVNTKPKTISESSGNALPVETTEPSSFHIFSDNSYESDDNDDVDDEDTICGGSMISLEETIVSLMEGFENVAQFTTDSMRSARSIFFADDDDLGPEMTAADDFEAQMKSIEDPEDSRLQPKSLQQTSTLPTEKQTRLQQNASPTHTRLRSEAAPKKVWVREYADCDEGLEERKEPRFNSSKAIAKRFPDKPTSSTHKAPIATTPSSKKQNAFRKRIPFLKSKKAGTEKSSKIHAYHDDDFDYDDDDSAYVVDIVVYNRQESVEPISAKTFLDPKPLMDFDEGETHQKQKKTKEKRASKNAKITSIEQVSSEAMTVDALSVENICCGGVTVGNNLLLSSQGHLEYAAKELKEMILPYNNPERQSGKYNREGQAVPSFDNTSAAIGSLLTDNKYNRSRDRGMSSKSNSEGQLLESFDNTTAALASMLTDERSLRNAPPDSVPTDEREGLRYDSQPNESAIERVNNNNRDKDGKGSRNPLRGVRRGRSFFRKKNTQGQF